MSFKIKKDMNFTGFIMENYRILILIVLILFPIFFICPMFVFHIKILLRNQTLCKFYFIYYIIYFISRGELLLEKN